MLHCRPAPPAPCACSADDFYKILTEPESNMIKQQQALLGTENVELIFTGATSGQVQAVAQSGHVAASLCC
jgi:ATP-dependent HslUV protease ATP-binding subunit HslU